MLPPALHAQEDRLEERVSRDNWFRAPATDLRRANFKRIVQELSSPAYEGRLPGTEGGRLTSEYIAQQFELMGLSPTGDQSTYRQSVPLTTMRSAAKIRYTFPAANGIERAPAVLNSAQYVAWTGHRKQAQTIKGNLVFVGYGVRAPEFDWDDYQNLDVNGRIVVMLTGDPPVRSAGNSDALDPLRFEGNAMTRHGRWNHKLALAAQLGASAALLIHDARAAGYPFSAVKNTFGQQRIYLSNKLASPDEPAISIWADQQAFNAMLDGTQLSLQTLKQLAMQQARVPVELPIALTTEIESQWEDFESHNVVARLEAAPSGSTSATQSKSMRPVVVMAHWDHLGPVAKPQPPLPSYYPGAADNASGIAQLLDIANRLKTVTDRARPIEFVALTAEESGLLGAQHYIRERLNNLTHQKPVAGVNIDIANIFGRARDVEVIGLGLSSLDLTLAEVARDMQRQVSADYAPNIGRLFRSDQYEFIRHGVPALWIRGGRESRSFLMRGPIAQIKRYLKSGYHQPGDSIQDWWNIDSALEDSNLIAAFVSRLSNQVGNIRFNSGSPYQR